MEPEKRVLTAFCPDYSCAAAECGTQNTHCGHVATELSLHAANMRAY